jgi:hypothetical protein
MLHLICYIWGKQRDRPRKYRDKHGRNYQDEPSFAKLYKPAKQIGNAAQKDRDQHGREDKQDDIESKIEEEEQYQRENDKTDGDQNSPGKCLIWSFAQFHLDDAFVDEEFSIQDRRARGPAHRVVT